MIDTGMREAYLFPQGSSKGSLGQTACCRCIQLSELTEHKVAIEQQGLAGAVEALANLRRFTMTQLAV